MKLNEIQFIPNTMLVRKVAFEFYTQVEKWMEESAIGGNIKIHHDVISEHNPTRRCSLVKIAIYPMGMSVVTPDEMRQAKAMVLAHRIVTREKCDEVLADLGIPGVLPVNLIKRADKSEMFGYLNFEFCPDEDN